MSELFKHPAWINKWSRSAIICLLALLPVSIIQQIWPTWGIAALGIILCGAALVLMLVAMRSARPELLPLPEPREESREQR